MAAMRDPFLAYADTHAGRARLSDGICEDEYRRLLARCSEKANLYTPRELDFLRSISGFIPRTFSAAQTEWLRRLADREPIDFERVNRDALAILPTLCKRWLPDGSLRGNEYVARNPTRADGKAGSFSINVVTGRWGDFATGDRGGDPVSLAAYLHCGGDQIEGGLALKRMLGA